MARLASRIALVTGGGRGIGRAIALALAREGADVTVTARSEDELAEVVAAITSEGGKGRALPADLCDRAESKRVIEHVGAIDVLVNNAGLGSSSNPKPVIEFDDEFWERSLLLNLTVPYLLSKAVLPAMRAKGWGRIINVASINGKVASFHGAAYSASKHGLLGFTKTLAMEEAKTGITVNAICPGPVKTVMNDRRIEHDAKRKGVSFEEQEASMTPMARRLEPEEIAPLAVYFASDEAKSVTGQSWNVDCGLVPF